MCGGLATRLKKTTSIGFKLLLMLMASIFCTAAFIMIVQMVLLPLAGLSRERLSQLEETYAFLYSVVFLGMTVLIFMLLSRRIIRRITAVNQAASQAGSGDFDVKLFDPVQDEIGELTTSVNQIVQQMRETLDSQKRAERMKHEMITHISHDLRTPLTSLLGYLDLLEASGGDAQTAVRYVQIAQRKGEELKSQVESMLEYCHLHFSDIKLSLGQVDAEALIRQVLIDFVPQLEAAGMRFDLECTAENRGLEADISLLVRCLQNIIRNSIAYGSTGGRLSLRIYSEGMYLHIDIKNYGEPISPEDLPFLFEELYRAERSRSSDTGGKGMGLSIAKRIMELHHGRISVRSSAEETVFTLSLPRTQADGTDGSLEG